MVSLRLYMLRIMMTRILFSVCGSQAIVQSVRRALRFPLFSTFGVKGDPSVTLHIESFGYA